MNSSSLKVNVKRDTAADVAKFSDMKLSICPWNRCIFIKSCNNLKIHYPQSQKMFFLCWKHNIYADRVWDLHQPKSSKTVLFSRAAGPHRSAIQVNIYIYIYICADLKKNKCILWKMHVYKYIYKYLNDSVIVYRHENINIHMCVCI